MAKSKAKGRLIAIDGIHGPDLVRAGREILKVSGCPRDQSHISVWDASGIFFELGHVKHKLGLPSIKTLLILYASDLAFRLRWEIEPALSEGRTVIAAPYLQTPLAAGCSEGIPRSWTANLLKFAAKPDAEFRIKEKRQSANWTPKRNGGFAEFCALSLRALSDAKTPEGLRDRMIDYWKYDPRAEHVRAINEKLLEKIAKRGL